MTHPSPGRDIHPRRHDSVPYAHLASFSIIGMAKPSLKSSLVYDYTRDTRDNLSVPTKVGCAAVCDIDE